MNKVEMIACPYTEEYTNGWIYAARTVIVSFSDEQNTHKLLFLTSFCEEQSKCTAYF